jgi:hypothetical protein
MTRLVGSPLDAADAEDFEALEDSEDPVSNSLRGQLPGLMSYFRQAAAATTSARRKCPSES